MTPQTEAPRFFYGWVIVGVGMVVTCIALGAMTSLGIFLQPMSEAMGWSRTGISTVALLALTFRSPGPLSAPMPSPSAG
jgi:hypothetical protein